MNGAPRIAPTPISSECSWPENRIATIGIIVSGSAVPTAASTEPTAPSASPSFLPNHSMPLVKSSAPARMTKNETSRISRSIAALACQKPDDHARGDDHQDQQRHRDHAPLAAAPEADRGAHHPEGRRRTDAEDAQPEEARRPRGKDVRQELVDLQRRAGGERRDPGREEEDRPDQDQADRGVGPDLEDPRQGRLEVGIALVVPEAGHQAIPRARRAISTAVYSRTTTNSSRKARWPIRCPSREPSVAPTNTPTAVGPAT